MGPATKHYRHRWRAVSSPDPIASAPRCRRWRRENSFNLAIQPLWTCFPSNHSEGRTRRRVTAVNYLIDPTYPTSTDWPRSGQFLLIRQESVRCQPSRPKWGSQKVSAKVNRKSKPPNRVFFVLPGSNFDLIRLSSLSRKTGAGKLLPFPLKCVFVCGRDREGGKANTIKLAVGEDKTVHVWHATGYILNEISCQTRLMRFLVRFHLLLVWKEKHIERESWRKWKIVLSNRNEVSLIIFLKIMITFAYNEGCLFFYVVWSCHIHTYINVFLQTQSFSRNPLNTTPVSKSIVTHSLHLGVLYHKDLFTISSFKTLRLTTIFTTTNFRNIIY